MLNGHSGSMSTGHANNPMDMLHRLETMMLMGIELPLTAIQQQIASALDVIIHLGRLRDKSRKVLRLQKYLGMRMEGFSYRHYINFRRREWKMEKLKELL